MNGFQTVPGESTPDRTARWRTEQERIRALVRIEPLPSLPRFVGGADCAFSRDKQSIHAVALIYDRQAQKVQELASVTRRVTAPYIPGYLSFREGPAVLEAIGRLRSRFDVICFDAQGMAHPRRCGLATHLGVLLDVPSIGVAKSRLIGEHDEPKRPRSSRADLLHGGERIGTVLRTKADVRPIYVSVGHRVDLDTACELVLACCTKYRIPEPTRQADIEVAKAKKRASEME